MRYRLRDGLYHCVAGRNIIFLDLPGNRYFAPSTTCAQAFRQLVERNGETFAGAKEALSSLIEPGLLVEAETPDHSFEKPSFERAGSDISRHDPGSFQFWRFMVAFYWELLTSLRLRLHPLSAVLNRSGVSRRPIGIAGSARLEIIRWASAFDRTALVLGRTNRCLVRSLAMFSVLRAHGVGAALVIGVRSDPFSAHAWVQHHDMVLNDCLEQINNYSPILVLR